jgi:hypothetical protein
VFSSLDTMYRQILSACYFADLGEIETIIL